jgi:hypothetical protein
MGADKNSYPKRELGICLKFTTKDSHTSLPRARNHNGPTNPRNKLQTILKWKHDSRSKGLSYPAKAQADGPRGWGGRSARTRRTVCDPWADSPLNATEPLEAHPEMRTVRTLPRTIWEQLVPRGRSATSGRTVRQTSCHKTLAPWKIYTQARKNWTNTRRTHTSRTVCVLQAASPPAHEQNSLKWKPRSQPPLSHHGSPKRLELLRKDLGEKWSVPRVCYAPKLGSSNEISRRESNQNRSQPKT